MQRHWVAILLLGLGGCTAYQPVEWDGRGSWSEARQLGPRPSSSVTASGLRHEIAPGETLSEVAVRYRVPVHALAGLNDIRSPYIVRVGQVLDLPTGAVTPRPAPVQVAKRSAPRSPVRPAPVPTQAESEVRVASLATDHLPAVLARPASLTPGVAEPGAQRQSPPPLSGNGFLWPVRGRIASAFGSKPNGTRNDGINIRAAEGTPVLAAENGIVVYAGTEIAGFGRMLLLSHADGFITAYAHNAKLLVDVGDRVGRGEEIAVVGSTGNVTSSQLHFEIRDGKKALDPVVLLDSAVTQVASVE
ncbi:MAG: peptidoglycan DD-metalloendopeptidase family protein [Geminicoccaceae bacterium]